MTRIRSRVWLAAAVSGVVAAGGCAGSQYDPDRATRPYPQDLHAPARPMPDGTMVREPHSVDIQVFVQGDSLEIVNSTATSYADCDLWLNQRYVRHLDALPAGRSVKLSLKGFYDVRGEAFAPGGFFATEAFTPVRLVEIQIDGEHPLVGLIAIKAWE